MPILSFSVADEVLKSPGFKQVLEAVLKNDFEIVEKEEKK